jgi:phage shock protein A
MGIWQRIKTLFSSNVNALLDAAEDPKGALDTLVKDMEVELRTTKGYLAEAIVKLKKLERDEHKHSQLAKDYEEKAKAILSDDDESNDYLAKEALVRKRENEAVASQFKAAADKQRQAVDTMKRNIEKMERKISDAQRKRGVLLAQSQIAETQAKIVQATSAGSGSSSAFAEFKRIEDKIEEKTERVQVEAELNSVHTVDEQLEEVQFGGEVDRELEALKKSIALEGKAPPKELPAAK